jgi:uncharacterized RDD family membrane protein YckC
LPAAISLVGIRGKLAQSAANAKASGHILIETPENVRFTYPAAGVGVRAIAYVIDLGIRLLPVLAAMIILSLSGALLEVVKASGIARTALILLVFGLQWGYYVLFETLWNGASPGKRAVGIRVVMDGGYPVTFTASAVRNLLRVFDALPYMYAFGIVAAFVSRKGKRLGDLAAGTIVVRNEPFDIRYLTVIEQASASSAGTSTASAPLAPAEIDLVTRFLERRYEFDDATRQRLAGQIVDRILSKGGVNSTLG